MMNRSMPLLGLCMLAALAPRATSAQVGYAPRKSPYRDLRGRQELTLLGGQYTAGVDPAGVAPVSGPTFGAHYEFHMTGPAYFTARSMVVLSERTVLDPTKLLVARNLGKKSVNLLLTDIGFALNLTGYKSWHGIVPSLGGGLGIGAAFDSPDVGQFKVGYPFLITVRPAIKFAPGGRWQGRIDAGNYFYRIRYPDSYFTKSTADPAVLETTDGRNVWKRNLGLTAGITYTFGR